MIGGIIVETLCSALLFVWDANFIGEQNDKIIALETRLAPRDLSPEQQSTIARAVNEFSGTLFDLAATHEKEPLNLLDEIEVSLIKARWVEVPWTGADVTRPGKPNVGTAIAQNVEIEVERGSTLFPIANELAKALSDQGIPAKPLFANTNMPSKNHAAVHVIVGTKP